METGYLTAKGLNLEVGKILANFVSLFVSKFLAIFYHHSQPYYESILSIS